MARVTVTPDGSLVHLHGTSDQGMPWRVTVVEVPGVCEDVSRLITALQSVEPASRVVIPCRGEFQLIGWSKRQEFSALEVSHGYAPGVLTGLGAAKFRDPKIAWSTRLVGPPALQADEVRDLVYALVLSLPTRERITR